MGVLQLSTVSTAIKDFQQFDTSKGKSTVTVAVKTTKGLYSRSEKYVHVYDKSEVYKKV